MKARPFIRISFGLTTSLLAVMLYGTNAAPATAQSYPTKPVRVLVGFPAGGPTDIVARVLAQKFSESLGQQFVVENRVGAGSNIAMGLVAKAAPDGYMLLVASSAFVVNPTLYGSNVTYDPYKDFAPVAIASDTPTLVAVNPSLPARTMKELIGLIHANPGKYSIATPAIGTTPDLAVELFKMSYKLDAVRVPFNGGAPAIQSVLQGQTPISFGAPPPATELVRSGQLRGLAVTGKHRLAALPDVPTMAEEGIPDQESDTFAGVLAPAGTPQPIIDLLYSETVKAVHEPAVKKRFADLGFEPVGSTPEQFASLIREEIEKWGKVIRAANIKVE